MQLPTNPLHFNDGAAYERYMGVWSRLVAEAFLDWIQPRQGLKWLDVGCGNGAFTELVFERYAPASLDGIDPSEEQLAFARTRPSASLARFQLGSAEDLPYPDGTFDAAVMPLVLHFLTDPARAVAEMARVVRPGGIVAAYIWDFEEGGFPYALLLSELAALGVDVPTPPRQQFSRGEEMVRLWSSAPVEEVEMEVITVERTFADFDEYWNAILGGPRLAAGIAGMTAGERERLKARLREQLPADDAGRISCSARANAIDASVPKPR